MSVLLAIGFEKNFAKVTHIKAKIPVSFAINYGLGWGKIRGHRLVLI